uniref:Monocyte to macrophage differentiation associated n=1 Tax=Bos mutus grunniens TaxID=30521 RepID=A0A8B9Y575_BOSMU
MAARPRLRSCADWPPGAVTRGRPREHAGGRGAGSGGRVWAPGGAGPPCRGRQGRAAGGGGRRPGRLRAALPPPGARSGSGPVPTPGPAPSPLPGPAVRRARCGPRSRPSSCGPRTRAPALTRRSSRPPRRSRSIDAVPESIPAFLIVPAIVGSALLHRLSDDCWEKITAWIYGMGLCALFIVSTVFHIVAWKKSHLRTVEHWFHMCDRMVIYFFIAASYAPWLNLRELGPLASHMRWFIWLMAAGGTIYVFLYHEKYKVIELFFYLTMGFSPALVVTSMNNTDGLHELACGGLIYCLGVVFFKSDGIIPFAHAIWHLFVATAAAVHYYAIWKYLYRSPTDFMRHL